MCKSCHKIDGNCLVCKDGYHGSECDKQCSSGCNSTICDKSDGVCDGCNDGYYGDYCNNTCSSNCKDEICDRDGSCSCKPGYSGTHCKDGMFLTNFNKVRHYYSYSFACLYIMSFQYLKTLYKSS